MGLSGGKLGSVVVTIGGSFSKGVVSRSLNQASVIAPLIPEMISITISRAVSKRAAWAGWGAPIKVTTRSRARPKCLSWREDIIRFSWEK